MPWFKVDDTLSAHPKARAAGLPAMGLWAVAGAYASQYLTEGFVPKWYVNSWPNGPKLAAKLVLAGLWKCAEGGWVFHQWSERQPSKEQVEQDREQARQRQQKYRDAKRSNRVSHITRNGVTNGVTHAVTSPSPPRPDPSRPLSTKDLSIADAINEFDEFYELYPKKVNPKPAKARWITAIKTTEPAEIMAGLRAQLPQMADTERRYIPAPDVWLHKGKWADEISAPDDGFRDQWARAVRVGPQ